MAASGFPYLWIFLPPIFLLFFLCRESWWGHCPWIIFSQIYVTFFMIYVCHLRFSNVIFCVCSLLVFFSTLCQYYMNYWTHPPFNCWQYIPDLWVCRNGKKKNTLSITLGCIFLWNVIKRIYLPCLQLISKNTFDEPWRGPPLLTSKVEEWLMITFVLENCLIDLFVVLDLDLGSILIDNSFFCLSNVGNKYYLFYLFLTTVWKMSFSVHV